MRFVPSKAATSVMVRFPLVYISFSSKSWTSSFFIFSLLIPRFFKYFSGKAGKTGDNSVSLVGVMTGGSGQELGGMLSSS